MTCDDCDRRNERLADEVRALRTAVTVTAGRLWAAEEHHPWRLLSLGLADECARLRAEVGRLEGLLVGPHAPRWAPEQAA